MDNTSHKIYKNEYPTYNERKNGVISSLIGTNIIGIIILFIGLYTNNKFYNYFIPIFSFIFMILSTRHILFANYKSNLTINIKEENIIIEYFSFNTKLQLTKLEIPFYKYNYKETVISAGAGTSKVVILKYQDYIFRFNKSSYGKEKLEELREDLRKYAENQNAEKIW